MLWFLLMLPQFNAISPGAHTHQPASKQASRQARKLHTPPTNRVAPLMRLGPALFESALFEGWKVRVRVNPLLDAAAAADEGKKKRGDC